MPKSASGFTLLELMVVLVLAGLLLGLVIPNLERLYESVVLSTERDQILDQFAALGREALAQGRDYAVFGTTEDSATEQSSRPAGNYQPYPLELPEGWRIHLENPVLVRANGICLGGEVTLLHAVRAPVQVRLTAPYCRVAGDA